MVEHTARDQFRLDVAARPEHIATARLFVSVVARTFELPEAQVEDLKLAASEVATAIILAGRHDTINVMVSASPTEYEVAIGPVAASDLTLAAVGPDPVAVVEAIFPGVELRDGAVRFAVASPAPA